TEDLVHSSQHAHGFARHIDTDTVAWNDCNSFHDPVSELYSATSAFKCDSSSLAKSIKIFRPLSSEICFAKSVKNWCDLRSRFIAIFNASRSLVSSFTSIFKSSF